MDIKPVVNKPDQNVIDGLELLLKEARAGEIDGLAFAIDYKNSEMNRGHFGKNSTALMGAAVVMQADLIDKWRGYNQE